MKPTTSSKSPVSYAKPGMSAAMQARKALLRRIQKQEIRRLQAMVPSLSRRPQRQIDDITVIEEAARYIDQLHKTLLARVQAGSLAPGKFSSFHYYVESWGSYSPTPIYSFTDWLLLSCLHLLLIYSDVLNRFNPAELIRIQQSQQQNQSSNSMRNPLAAVNTKFSWTSPTFSCYKLATLW